MSSCQFLSHVTLFCITGADSNHLNGHICKTSTFKWLQTPINLKSFTFLYDLVSYCLLPTSKPCMWVLLLAWLWWSCIAARPMGTPVPSAAWPGTLTAPGTDRCARGTWRTANAASADRTSDTETPCCSVPIRIWVVSSTNARTDPRKKCPQFGFEWLWKINKTFFYSAFTSFRCADRNILLPISRLFP